MAGKSQKPSPDGWLTPAAYARRIDRDRGAVHALIDSGVLVLDARGLLDPVASDAAREAAQWSEGGPGRPKKDAAAGAEPKPPGKPKGLVYWKTVGAREDALKKKLERLERERSLVRRDLAEAEAATLMATVRSRMDGLGRGLQDALAACAEPRKCGDMVDGAIRKVFEALADGAPEEESVVVDARDDRGSAQDDRRDDVRTARARDSPQARTRKIPARRE